MKTRTEEAAHLAQYVEIVLKYVAKWRAPIKAGDPDRDSEVWFRGQSKTPIPCPEHPLTGLQQSEMPLS